MKLTKFEKEVDKLSGRDSGGSFDDLNEGRDVVVGEIDGEG